MVFPLPGLVLLLVDTSGVLSAAHSLVPSFILYFQMSCWHSKSSIGFYGCVLWVDISLYCEEFPSFRISVASLFSFVHLIMLVDELQSLYVYGTDFVLPIELSLQDLSCLWWYWWCYSLSSLLIMIAMWLWDIKVLATSLYVCYLPVLMAVHQLLYFWSLYYHPTTSL